jgi:hypothetical protein
VRGAAPESGHPHRQRRGRRAWAAAPGLLSCFGRLEAVCEGCRPLAWMPAELGMDEVPHPDGRRGFRRLRWVSASCGATALSSASPSSARLWLGDPEDLAIATLALPSLLGCLRAWLRSGSSASPRADFHMWPRFSARAADHPTRTPCAIVVGEGGAFTPRRPPSPVLSIPRPVNRAIDLETAARVPAAEAIRQAREEVCGTHSGASRETSITGTCRIPSNCAYGRCWARTSDLRLVEAALSQLS